MGLTKKQKEQLKKEVKKTPLQEAAEKLGISPQEGEAYLLKIWGRQKYQKIAEKAKQEEVQILNPWGCNLNSRGWLKGWLNTHWKIFIFLTFLVFAVYLNSLGNDFVSDDMGIKNDPSINNFSYLTYRNFNLRSTIIFFTHKLFGPNPLFFRLSNILFHLGSVWLVFFLLNFFFASPIPLFAASIFAVHPILTESVTWISGGPYSNSAFFILFSLTTYLLWKKSPKNRFYLVSLLSFVLALGFSEKVLWLPAILILFEFLFKSLKKNWLKIIPYAAASGLWMLYLMGRISSRVASLEISFYQEPGLDNPFIQIPIAVSSYLKLIFWPKDLAFYHSEMVFTQAQYLLHLGLFIIFLGLIFYFFKKDRRIFFWFSFFLISLSPNLTPLRVGWIVAERYVYLGSLGIFVLISLGIHKIGEIFKNQKISYFLLAVIILAFSARTVVRNTDWKNQDSLWLATAKTSPSSPQNHNNLGDYYARHGNLEKAAEEFQIAIKLNPGYADAYHNLANTYQQMGETGLAIKNYQEAVKFNPNLWQSSQNLAAIYFQEKKFEQAEEYLQEALKASPQNPNLYVNLGVIYFNLGKTEEARKAIHQALRLDPQNQAAKRLLGIP